MLDILKTLIPWAFKAVQSHRQLMPSVGSRFELYQNHFTNHNNAYQMIKKDHNLRLATMSTNHPHQ